MRKVFKTIQEKFDRLGDRERLDRVRVKVGDDVILPKGRAAGKPRYSKIFKRK